MHRIISIFFVMAVLLIGMGTFVSAQNCPNIGETFANGGVAWDGESERISVCFSKDWPTPIPPVDPNSPPTFARRWKRTTTTYYQEPGSCDFFAYRKVTQQKDYPPLEETGYKSGWYDVAESHENTWFTGLITDNGRKIVMQAAPATISPSYTVFGDITNVRRRGRIATEITFTSSTSMGDANGIDNPYERCSYTSWGTSSRQIP